MSKLDELLNNTKKAFETLAGAVKTAYGRIGDLSTLKTGEKTSITAAINELFELTKTSGNGVSEERVKLLIAALKTELQGGELKEELNSLKEIADKLASLEGDQSIKAAVLAKFAEQNERLDTIEAVLKTDFVKVINDELAK